MGTKKSGKISSKSSQGEKSNRSFKISKEPVREGAEEDPHKFEVTQGAQEGGEEAFHAPEELGELPQNYGETMLYLVARDPRWLFTYWEVDWSNYPASKMKKGERKIFLKVYNEAGEEEAALEVKPEVRNWYVPVSTPGEAYAAELGYFDKKDQFVPIVRSRKVTTPSEQLSEEETAEFATVPMHLTFERLIDMIKAKVGSGESLTAALSRTQEAGRRFLFANGAAPEWTEEQKLLLAALLGEELISRSGLSSGEIQEILRKKLEEYLSSESASGLFAKGFPGMELSSLFSGITSWGRSEVSSFGLGGVSSFEVGGISSLGLGGVSSYGVGGVSSAQLGGVSSWGAGVSSLSSGLWGPGVSSLFSGIGASWSGQPFGQQRERGFFMHVNAEVIFYGGTDPEAKVWIDGQEIKLQPDGSFRYHFRFPDGNYTIPIVAQSPDKVEERSATLAFERCTDRQGEVGHTAQPAELANPIGAK